MLKPLAQPHKWLQRNKILWLHNRWQTSSAQVNISVVRAQAFKLIGAPHQNRWAEHLSLPICGDSKKKKNKEAKTTTLVWQTEAPEHANERAEATNVTPKMVELCGLHNLRLKIAHSKPVDLIPTETKDFYAFFLIVILIEHLHSLKWNVLLRSSSSWISLSVLMQIIYYMYSLPSSPQMP